MQPIDSLTRTIIRDMRAEDRDPVIEILTGSDPWKRLGFTAVDWNRIFAPLPTGRDTFVLEIEGNVLGIAIVRRKFLFGDYLELLGISPSAIGRGLGSRLLTHVESLTFARANNMFACVSDFNEAARAFYRKQGYKEIGPMPNFLIPGYAEILLRKTTGPARKS
ncbi:MAG: GNAT family N-acetyltransferase [Nitrospira sp.]|nr:GNAT family N-acetyltransferase [Nitrospira sp.]MBP8154511.1 GNAT family N-acetyltransferase [Nitrospira sp.]